MISRTSRRFGRFNGNSLSRDNFVFRQSAHISIGQEAPDFELLNFQGKPFKLSSYKDKSNVVVFFYPADSTPGCTTELCAFERKAPEFKVADTVLFGISSGGASSKRRFLEANKVKEVELLIDPDNKVRKSWNVPKALFGVLPGRVTYVIGKDGKVKLIFDDLIKTAMHPEKALRSILEVNSSSSLS